MPITINGSGTVTGLSVGGLPDGTVDSDTLASSITTGKVIQVVEARMTSNFSTTATGDDQDVSGATLNITPASSSNKILISFNAYCAFLSGTNNNPSGMIGLYRGSTIIGAAQVGSYQADSASKSTRHHVHLQIYDAPSTTSQVTYKIQARTADTNTTMQINILGDPTWDNVGFNGHSATLLAQEIAA